MSWAQAIRVNNFTRAVAADTGEPLYPDRRVTSLIGGLGAAALTLTVWLNGYVWLFALDQQYGRLMLGITVLQLLSLIVALIVITANLVTFRPARTPDR